MPTDLCRYGSCATSIAATRDIKLSVSGFLGTPPAWNAALVLRLSCGSHCARSAARIALSQRHARSAAEMTPPSGLKDRAKRLVLRGILDRLRPLAYTRAAGGVRCLTFHYLFPDERSHARRLFAALKREAVAGDTTHWRVESLSLPVGGEWQVTAKVRLSQFDLATLTGQLSLPDTAKDSAMRKTTLAAASAAPAMENVRTLCVAPAAPVYAWSAACRSSSARSSPPPWSWHSPSRCW